MALTDKLEMFCREYLIDLNAILAIIRAGYSENTTRKIGSENLTKPDSQDRISELKSQHYELVGMSTAFHSMRVIGHYQRR
ncbi:terminase small subunit [Klebsiella sp. Ap-873]|nr:terminase small subunit [Klebsiella sp. Ap-873]